MKKRLIAVLVVVALFVAIQWFFGYDVGSLTPSERVGAPN
jgi:preprotein translocase subunit SecE